MGYELLVTLEHTDKGVIATCEELNAVASGATEEEALENLMQAVEALIETYGDEVKERLKERSLKVVEVP
ncbi:type II toxin-antitoxin system HicB family antitoxin [Fervidibacter sacchari]|uniref:RNase H-like HicB family nuclease n=1 Tax=Candidatus Fervidibacter sacchari TaxID=1448929 RepID=A0ABT2EPG6_9BACT|nr:type II toxin-antitoxin system HicB family antitoxin [Candidatus Fervidibacter sacchari]MCS3919850.1 putative RNase H-like HicB family nuclease [Candidatus Fervidibacter sacchari]WKU16911.1 type II toxin-antitoxin system HicB family antitoxin [Candidatus Fervidibacter sacchari]